VYTTVAVAGKKLNAVVDWKKMKVYAISTTSETVFRVYEPAHSVTYSLIVSDCVQLQTDN